MPCPLTIMHDDEGPEPHNFANDSPLLFQLEITENEVCLIAVRAPWASLMFKYQHQEFRAKLLSAKQSDLPCYPELSIKIQFFFEAKPKF